MNESIVQNDLQNLSSEAVDQLVKKITTEFQKDILKINQNYKQNIEASIDLEQSELLGQYKEKA